VKDLSKRSETSLEKIDKLKNFIAIRRREITAYRAKLRAMKDIGMIEEEQKKVLNEAQDKAEEVLGAEAELGKILAVPSKSEKATSSAKGTRSLPANITKKQSYETQKICNNWPIVEDYMEESRAMEQIATHTGAIKEINIKFRPKTPPMIKGKFDVIYADPPWDYDFSATDSRRIDFHYPSMKLENIENLKLPDSKNAVLFLWATAPKLQEALKVIIAWGYEYKTHAIWDKEITGMGYWFRGQHELLLVSTKGKGVPPEATNRFSSIIREKRGKHSRKPERAYEILETMFPEQKKIELFATKRRPGWIFWGIPK